jgi:large subunit ribosomal protein L10
LRLAVFGAVGPAPVGDVIKGAFMAGPRPEKVAVVEEVREHLANSGAAILTEYRGLKVGDLAVLRRQLRTAGADYKIFKNTLVRRATAGTDRASLDPYLQGPTAIAFVRDDVGAVAKVLRDFSRAHPELIVKGGFLGTQVVDAQGAGALADLPSRDVLLAQLAGAIAAPMRQFAGLLQALPRSFAYGLSALLDKRGGGAVPAEPEVADTATGEAEGAAGQDAVSEPEASEPEASEPEASEPEATEPVEAAAAATETAEPEPEPVGATEPAETSETGEAVEGGDAAPTEG